jgi:integrase/recombinase XerD
LPHTSNDFSVHNISVDSLEQLAQDYLSDCELRLYSPHTIETRRVFLRNLLWFLRARNYTFCGTMELRQFFHYLMHGHEEPGGRFGNKNLTRPVRPVTVMDYYTCVRSLFDWLVAQRVTVRTPFEIIAKPQVREESKTALGAEHILALIQACGKSTDPKRNAAIIALLLDTGCRASELISMRRKDVDLTNRRCRVLGKGDKYRTLFFGQKTADILEQYLLQSPLPQPDTFLRDDAPLFAAARGDKPLTRSGLLHLVKRLGKYAGMKDIACVHALRRTFAVQMLRNGANVFSVQSMLGHTNLQQTRKYCVMALTDTEAQHRQYSPLDRLVLSTAAIS